MKKVLLISWGITLIGLIGLLLHPNRPNGYSGSLQGYGDDRRIKRMNPYDPPIYHSQKAQNVKMEQYQQQYLKCFIAPKTPMNDGNQQLTDEVPNFVLAKSPMMFLSKRQIT